MNYRRKELFWLMCLFRQIPLCNGSQQTWGLVEYMTAAEAEDTVVALKDLTIHGHKIRIRYCTPGKRAINLYTKFLTDFVSNILLSQSIILLAKCYNSYQNIFLWKLLSLCIKLSSKKVFFLIHYLAPSKC